MGTCVIINTVSAMEHRDHQEDVATRVHDLLREAGSRGRVAALRKLAAGELEHGYPREALLDEFERVRSQLEAQNRDEEEDDIVTVMDALVGWCPPGAKL